MVYVNYEMPIDYFVSLSNMDPIPENFFVVNRPEPRLKPETIKAIISAMNQRGFVKGLMVIDSFRGAFKLQAEQENHAGGRWINSSGGSGDRCTNGVADLRNPSS